MEARDIVMERVLVVGPRDTLAMVDDLAPKGWRDALPAIQQSLI